MTERPASHDEATDRAALVDHLARALSGTGAYGETLEAIAHETQVDPALLRQHFGDRMSVLLALLEWHDTRGAPGGYGALTDRIAVFDTMSAEELVGALMGTARRHATTPGYVRLTALLKAEASALRHPAQDILRQRQSIFHGIIAKSIQSQREALGSTADPLTPEERASTVIATWEGLLVYGDLNPGRLDVLWVLELTLRQALELSTPARPAPRTATPASPDDAPSDDGWAGH